MPFICMGEVNISHIFSFLFRDLLTFTGPTKFWDGASSLLACCLFILKWGASFYRSTVGVCGTGALAL